MFNRELKEEILELKKRVWMLENPPKFEIGDKVKIEYIEIKGKTYRIIDRRFSDIFYSYEYEIMSEDYTHRVFISEDYIKNPGK